jgi:hypothetical protein
VNAPDPKVIRSFSFGGGVQSTAALVLAVQGDIDFQTFLFANTGDDSEHPDTLRYVREISMPYAAEHGIEVVELHREFQRGPRAGQTETLRGRLMREGSRSIPIPMRMDGNGAPATRSCTADFKIRVIGRELKRRGATVENPAVVGLGISVDEIERAKPGVDPKAPYQHRTYPLLDLGMTRHDCMKVISAAGLPVPPKSACYFCPFHNREAWRRLRTSRPDLFADACEIEVTLNRRRAGLGKAPMWMTDRLLPLDRAIDDQLSFEGMDGSCDSGFCFT